MNAMPVATAGAAQRGVTLIELIAFIVIMGIASMTLLGMYRAVLPRGATPAEITLATQLAQERMELILGQRAANGYSPLADPCGGGTPPAICTQLGLYSVIVRGVASPVPWSVSPVVGAYREVGVTVLGPDGIQHANLSAVMANY
jgi:hypothetical protein